MATRRGEQLKTVAAEFCRIHDEWVEDKNRPAPDEIYWDGVQTLLDSFASGDIPEESRALAEAVEEFRDVVEDYDQREDPQRNLYPPDDFWKARERVAGCLLQEARQASLPPLETIPSLAVLPGITHLQIAKIYGFKDRHGQYLPHLVQRELDTPGSVLKQPGTVDGQDWQDPRIQTAKGQAVAERHATAISEKRKRAAKNSQPCKETPRELWELTLGQTPLSIQQAARMLCRSEAEVAQLFAAFDDERQQAIVSGVQGEHVDALTAAIREKAAAGMTLGAIAKELKTEPRKVAEALKGWKAPEPAGAKE